MSIFRNVARCAIKIIHVGAIGRAMATSSSSSSPSNQQRSTRFDGKVAIVTGSTDGIGLATAHRLAEDGAHVVVSSRKKEKVDRALSTLKGEGLTNVSGLVCHVGKKEDRQALVDHAIKIKGQIDILVANAGMNPYFGRTLAIPEATWDKVFDINLKAAFFLTQEVVKHMEKRNSGSIVYVSSFVGLQPSSEIGAYSVAKTALLGLTKVIAKECGFHNIRVNCLAPGWIKTHMSKAMWSDESVSHIYTDATIMKRFGDPEEMAAVIAFLCSDDASYVTGETFSATGGMPARL